jgi:toxin-antitoxin system PIN domain toxin
MYLIDVNVLLYAFRSEMPDSDRYAEWLNQLLLSGERFGMSELVLSGFLRIVTNPKIFIPPTTLDRAMKFVEEISGNPNCVRILPGVRHWNIFLDLCRAVNARGNLISDAYLAALAIESNCEWITVDRHYALFPGLRQRHPLG